MTTIKKSNTTRIFEKNNFGKFLPIFSNENLIETLINRKGRTDQTKDGNDLKFKVNDFLESRRLPIGEGNFKIEPALISQLLQSVTTYGKFTNEIINEVKSIKGLNKAFKITYISRDEYKNIAQIKDLADIPDVLSHIDINTMLYGADGKQQSQINKLENLKNVNDKSQTYPYLRDRDHPGLSAIQVLNPEFRGCFKNSQELDLFFNMISTLDMSMAIPYVNAEFLIPQKVTKNTFEGGDITNTNSKSYLTASLNNFILGDDYFIKDENKNSKYDSVLDTAKAINGDFKVDELTTIRNSVRTSSNDVPQTQIKKTYNRQFLNNAIFFAPQTMVNGDYNIADNPNAMVDKFRPFMTINNLSFDVRPTKGLLFYKTATMELLLYDKARMSQIAPFIKPELLNTVSSEIILEYGWQSNLGDLNYGKSNVVNINGQDIQYSENPIAEFLNSLKVREKYIIVNSSYTINQNGTVNISLSLAMKGPAELRGLSFRQDIKIATLQTTLNEFVEIIQAEATTRKFKTKNVEVSKTGATTTDVKTVDEIETTGLANLNQVVKDISVDNLTNETLDKIIVVLNKTTGIKKAYINKLIQSVEEAKKSLADYNSTKDKLLEEHFPFFKTHDYNNDPFIDNVWWPAHLGQIKNSQSTTRTATEIDTSSDPKSYNTKDWISLGKLLTSIIGRRLIEDGKKYDEVQFVFYNLNGKAIQASFLNIASIPVDINLFKSRLLKMLNNSLKLSYEGILEFILNIAVNQKAAAVYGLGDYFKFSENNSTEINYPDFNKADELKRKKIINDQTNSVKSAIFKQYYGEAMPTVNTDTPTVYQNAALNELSKINSGIFDLTFNLPKVVMNFDSTYHENDPNSSILRISFYDSLDNPFETVTELMMNLQKNDYRSAINGITTLRSKILNAKTQVAKIVNEEKNTTTPQEKSNPKNTNKKSQNSQAKPVDEPGSVATTTDNVTKVIDSVKENIARDTADQVYQLIKERLIILKDEGGNEIPFNEINNNSPLGNSNIKTIAINIKNKDKIKTFSNMKNVFKTYMPSLTFGQSNSALLSGNITTNQDAKYSTVLLMQQNGEEAEKEPTKYDFELFNQMNNAPMWVIPAQASAQIIGCPIVNFSQLIFLDFNTGTSIDNMYFINGIKHSISPGKFTTDLTLVQKDVYSQFEAEATAIAAFFKSVDEWNKIKTDTLTNKLDEIKNNAQVTTKTNTNTTAATNTVSNSKQRFQINLQIDHTQKGS